MKYESLSVQPSVQTLLMAPRTSLSLAGAKAREDLLHYIFFGSEKASGVDLKTNSSILSCDHVQYQKPISEE